jgi:hypothetical protein
MQSPAEQKHIYENTREEGVYRTIIPALQRLRQDKVQNQGWGMAEVLA